MILKVAESVSIGHPDKLADYISDSLLTAALKKDPNARCAFETFAADTHVVLGGEHTSADVLTAEERKEVVKEAIDYVYGDYYQYDITDYIHGQSANLNAATNSFGDDFPAGDQGFMVGFASNETPSLMPLEIYLAKWLSNLMFNKYKEDSSVFRADSKSQVVVSYDGDKPAIVKSVLISTSHADGKTVEEIRELATKEFIEPFVTYVKETFGLEVEERLVNPAGLFAIYGPVGDTGLTGRKLVVDNYGSAAPIGGGAFSGKDYSKVDRSGAYYARYVAKNIVASGIAKKCEIQVGYAIGVAKPVSLYVDTFGTSKYSNEQILEAVNKFFNFQPKSIRNEIINDEVSFKALAEYGHVGRADIYVPWEKTNKAYLLRAYFKQKYGKTRHRY